MVRTSILLFAIELGSSGESIREWNQRFVVARQDTVGESFNYAQSLVGNLFERFTDRGLRTYKIIDAIDGGRTIVVEDVTDFDQ